MPDLITILFCYSISAGLIAADQTSALTDLSDDFFYSLDDEDNIPWGVTLDITQDRQGFIWLGSQKGLLRFDGYDFNHYRHDSKLSNSIAGDWVNLTYATSDGKLWLSTESGISVYDPKHQSFLNFIDAGITATPYLSQRVMSMMEQGEFLWIATPKGLLRLNQSSLEIRLFDHPEPTEKIGSIYDLALDQEGWLWLAAADGLHRIHTTKLAQETAVANIRTKLRKLAISSDNRLWIGSDQGEVLMLDLSNSQSNSQSNRPSAVKKAMSIDIPIAKTARIVDILEARHKEIWVSQWNNGIMVFNSESGEFKRHLMPKPHLKNGLKSKRIETLFKDDSGLVWLGYYGEGISLHNGQNESFSVINIPPSSDGQPQTSRFSEVIEDHQGTIWLSSDTELVSISTRPLTAPQYHRKIKEQLDNLDPRSLVDLILEPSGKLLFLTFSGLLIRYDPESKQLQKLDLVGDKICSGTQDSSKIHGDFLWIACRSKNALMRVNLANNNVVSLNISNDFPAAYINTLALDKKDTLWIGTKKGLFKLPRATSATSSIQTTELNDTYVVGLLASKTGDIWVDSYQGLFLKRQDHDHFNALNETLGLAMDQVFGNMLEDRFGRIWGDDAVLEPVNNRFYRLQVADGFKTGPNWLGGAIATRTGLLLFPSDDALLIVTPALFQVPDYASRISISQQFINGFEHIPARPGRLLLEPGNDSFAYEISALDYSAPQKIQYRYRLVGYNDKWRNIDAKHRRVTYTNLSPADYELEFMASNRSGDFGSHVLKIDIKVDPQWYQTTLARLMAAVFVVLLIYGFVNLRSRQLIRCQILLEQLVQSRTDDLKQTQARLMVSEKQASLGRLVRGVAHELNTPLGIMRTAVSMIEAKAEDLVRSIDLDHVGKLSGQILKTNALLDGNIQKVISLVENFKLIATDNQQHHLSLFKPESHIRLTLNQYRSALTININGSPELEISSDKVLLGQIICELAENTIRHAFDDATVDKRLMIDFKLTRQSTGEFFNLSIEDNGRGMPEDFLDSCFDPFSAASVGSVGLGLHIVFNIITLQLGGQITCHNNTNQGTRFEILLPLAVRKQEPGRPVFAAHVELDKSTRA